MRIKIFTFFLILFVSACSNVEFSYKNDGNLTNPIYNKTKIFFSGEEISSIYRYVSEYFGNNENHTYELTINIDEKKTKRAVQTNQAISKLDYELDFKYRLFNVKNNCDVFNKKLISRFSFEPKSEGYNFGSDQSLQKLYELSAKNNLQEFISLIPELANLKCINEN